KGTFEVESGSVEGRVRGPLASLELDANVKGDTVHAAGYEFDTLVGHARGPIASPNVDAKLRSGHDTLDATARIDAKAKGASGVKVRLSKEGSVVEGTIARIHAEGGGVALQGVDLAGKGVGSLKGSLLVRGRDVTGTLHGEDVDMDRVSQLAGIP